MNITLYKAAQELAEQLDQFDPETGELGEGYEKARQLVEQKSYSVASYILQRDSEVEMLKGHAKEVLARAKEAEKRNDKLREYLAFHMKQTGITLINGDDVFKVKLHLDRDKSVDIFEPDLVPKEYLEDPKPLALSKSKISAAIKEGKEVPGARIQAKDRLEIK